MSLPALDARLHARFADLNGQRYHYLHARPDPRLPPRATIFLLHGWPDLSFGWRRQIPMLLDLGLEICAPDLLGFGSSAAPIVGPDHPDHRLSLYGLKRACDDIAALAKHIGASSIILGGHDWGGFVVYRVALWHPGLVRAFFSVCTPYIAPTPDFVSLDQLVARAPQFGYQKHLAGPEVEARVKGKHQIRLFLNAIYGARTPSHQTAFDPKTGVDFEALQHVGKTKLLSDREMDYYVDEYAKNGMHGTLNWYRTRKVNWQDELQLKSAQIHCPVLFIAADRDSVLLPSLSVGMERTITKLTRRNVSASHWALWEAPETTNAHIKEWLETAVLDEKSKL